MKRDGKGKIEEERWEKIAEGFLYVPGSEDIGCRIKVACVPRSEEDQEGPEVQVEGVNGVEAGPGECPFEIRQRFTKNKLKGVE